MSFNDFFSSFSSVQDADRLDAIGAMGVFRVAAYSGATYRPLYIADENADTAYNHFFEKLLKIKDQMKTIVGKKVAEKRHMFLEETTKHILTEYGMADFS